VAVIQDITRLRQAEQLKDDFLSLISHEFRTPLTAINGGAQLLAQRGDSLDDATRISLLTDIVTESAALERMLANMLTLTAIQAGRLEPDTEPILVRQSIRMALTAAKIRHPDHAFVLEIPEAVVPAEGDDALLQQVLRNLYENAAKYSPPGSTITTRIAEDDGQLIIHVTDEGSGIAGEYLDTVFERFSRPGADPTIRGTGLGLYLSRHLMEAQGGTIGVTSPGPGKGATFSIALPIAAEL
jgi:K+-sensing histidine kinase KdpD